MTLPASVFSDSNHSEFSFLSGGGEMGELMRAFDWSKTTLGTMDTWPQSLRTTISILLSSRFPMFVWWGEYLIQFYNDAYRLSLGTEGKHPVALGQKGQDCWPEIWSVIQPLIQQVRDGGEATWSENQLVPIYRNGKLEDVYWTFSYSPVKEESGRVGGVLVVCNETTQHFMAQKSLEESEERFRTLADHIPNLAWIANKEGWIFWYNSRWYEYTGTTPQEMEGWGWQSVHNPDMLPQVMEQWTLSIATGKPFEMVFPLKGADGVFKPFLTRVMPVFDDQGRVIRWLGTNTNIYEQQLAQQHLQALNEELATTTEELAAANEELVESNRQLTLTNLDLDNFIYTASHDLKAPISNIEALLQALLRTLSPESLASERAQRITAMMQESVERFKKTIASLTEVVKLQKENGPESVLIDLSGIVKDVILDLESLISSSGAQVSVASCPWVRFSEKNLRSVVYNLLSNALKYRCLERIPQIHISCHSTPEYHMLSIEDNGLGMEAGCLGQLFTMFKRFHDHVEGSGIGLYMIKKMVDNATGKIEVESQVGQGSTFKVFFPR